MALRWLARHAERTAWRGDDIMVEALRTVAPWAAVAGGAASAAAALPLTRAVQHTTNQVLTLLVILVATVASARVVADLVRSVTQSRSGVGKLGDDLREHHPDPGPRDRLPHRAADAGHLHRPAAHRPRRGRSRGGARAPGHAREPLRGHPHPRLQDRAAGRLHPAEQRRGGLRRGHQLAPDDRPRAVQQPGGHPQRPARQDEHDQLHAAPAAADHPGPGRRVVRQRPGARGAGDQGGRRGGDDRDHRGGAGARAAWCGSTPSATRASGSP